MKMVRPTAITDAVLTSSNVVEPFPGETSWLVGTAYVVGNVVARPVSGVHRLYQCLVANTGNTPETNTTGTTPKWLDIGPTNRWGMFDAQVGTATTAASPITVVLTPGNIDSLGLLQLVGDSVRVQMTAGGTTVYDKTYSLVYGAPTTDWYAYFFGAINKRTDLAITDLPPYASGIVTITISAATGNVSCGMCVVGQLFDFSGTQYGATIGIIDYSRKDIDAFGNPTLTKRKYIKKMDAKMMLDTSSLDIASITLAAWRSTAVLWIGADNLYTSLIVFGFCRDWSADVTGPTFCTYSLSVEGMI
jgi:hypothetical protein